MVKGLVGMGGNFSGASIADFCLLAPLNYYGIGFLKLHFTAALYLQSHIIGVYENALKNPFKKFD